MRLIVGGSPATWGDVTEAEAGARSPIKTPLMARMKMHHTQSRILMALALATAANLVGGHGAVRAAESPDAPLAKKAPTLVKLATEGRALVPIVLAPHAEVRCERLAEELAA